MPTVEDILRVAPHEVQLVVKAPHYIVDKGRVYWQKMKVSKELIPIIVGIVENGVVEEDKETVELLSTIRELNIIIDSLRENNKTVADNLDKSIIELETIKSAYNNYVGNLNTFSNSINPESKTSMVSVDQEVLKKAPAKKTPAKKSSKPKKTIV